MPLNNSVPYHHLFIKCVFIPFRSTAFFRAFTGALYQFQTCIKIILCTLIFLPQLFHKPQQFFFIYFREDHSTPPFLPERTHKAKGITNTMGLIMVRTSNNNINNAFTSAVNVDVEVTVLRFCSKFVGFGIRTNFELYKKEEKAAASPSRQTRYTF